MSLQGIRPQWVRGQSSYRTRAGYGNDQGPADMGKADYGSSIKKGHSAPGHGAKVDNWLKAATASRLKKRSQKEIQSL